MAIDYNAPQTCTTIPVINGNSEERLPNAFERQ